MIHPNIQIVPAVTPEERAKYEEEALLPHNINKEATSEGFFRFDILGTPHSAWNKSAARVFADFTIRRLCLPNTTEMFQAVCQAFSAHLETIIRKYKVSLKPRAEQLRLQAHSRRRVRKYEVCVCYPDIPSINPN
jgi:hypothetical protein